MNRMRCKSADGSSWTVVRVKELRERLKIAPFDPLAPGEKTITVDEAVRHLKICVGSVYRLIREGTLPATQLMRSAPWQIPLAALDTEAVRIGVRNVIERRPNNFVVLQDLKTLKLPGVE
jgi:excisionase family DNA binding protein